MGEALNKFVEEARHLSETFDSHTVFSIGGWDISQYTLYMFFILALVLMVVLIGGRKLQLVPKNKFLNTVEYGYDFVNTSIGQDVIGEGFKKHIPFLCTLFFFILIANVVGLIPGAKATTGTISITWALAAISFVYFNFYGLKTLGVFGYIKSLVPSGVPAPMVPIIWFLEFFSMVTCWQAIWFWPCSLWQPPCSCSRLFSAWTSLPRCLLSHGSFCWSSCMRWSAWWRSFRRTCSPFCPLPTSAWRFIPTDVRTGGASRHPFCLAPQLT